MGYSIIHLILVYIENIVSSENLVEYARSDMSLCFDDFRNSVVLQVYCKNHTLLAYHSFFHLFVDTSPNTHHIISVDTYYDLIHLFFVRHEPLINCVICMISLNKFVKQINIIIMNESAGISF